MAGFATSEDVYASPVGWTEEDSYGCYRWLSRLVSKAPYKEFYRLELTGLRINEMNHQAQAMLKVLLAESPVAARLLSNQQSADLSSVTPLDPPITISDSGLGLSSYMSMGLIV